MSTPTSGRLDRLRSRLHLPRFEETIRARPPGFPYERTIAIAIIVVGAVLVGWWSSNLWFFTDIWDHLAMRDLSHLGDWLDPHRGHWQVPSTVQTQLIYHTVGLDYWPWFHLPRAIGWGLFSYFFWWFLRHRGAYPLPAMAALAFASFLPTSAFFQSAHIGTPISLSCLIGVALLIERRTEPRIRDQALLFGLVMLSLMSSVLGTTVLVSAGVMALAAHRLRKWIIPLAVNVAVYGGWVVSQNVAGATYRTASRSILQVPWAVAVNAVKIIHDSTRLHIVLSTILALLAVVWLVWLIWKRRLTPFDVAMIVAVGFYIAATAFARNSLGRDNVTMNMTPFILMVIIPHLTPLPRRTAWGERFAPWLVPAAKRWAMPTAAVIITVVTVFNAVHLHDALAKRTDRIDRSRAMVERMAVLMAEGEVYGEDLKYTDINSSMQMTLGGLQRVLDDGWEPERPETATQEEAIASYAIEGAAQIRLRVSFFGSNYEGEPPLVLDHVVDDRGCSYGGTGEAIALLIEEPTDIRVRVSSPRSRDDLEVSWSDGTHLAYGVLNIKAKQLGRTRVLHVVGSPGSVFVLSSGEKAKVRVCGVVPSAQMAALAEATAAEEG